MNEGGSLVGFLIVVAVVAKLIWWIVAAAIAIGVYLFLRATVRQHRAEMAALARGRAEIIERADEQHRLVLAGDKRGVYGLYPPAI